MEKPKIKLNILERITVKVPIKKQAKELMRALECGDWTFTDGTPPTESDFWNHYKRKTCVNIKVDNVIRYSSRDGDFIEANNIKAISDEDFYKTQIDLTSEKRAEINDYFDNLKK